MAMGLVAVPVEQLAATDATPACVVGPISHFQAALLCRRALIGTNCAVSFVAPHSVQVRTGGILCSAPSSCSGRSGTLRCSTSRRLLARKSNVGVRQEDSRQMRGNTACRLQQRIDSHDDGPSCRGAFVFVPQLVKRAARR
jgi:hypothetical protein